METGNEMPKRGGEGRPASKRIGYSIEWEGDRAMWCGTNRVCIEYGSIDSYYWGRKLVLDCTLQEGDKVLHIEKGRG